MADIFVGDNDHGDTPVPPLSDLLWAEEDKVRPEDDIVHFANGKIYFPNELNEVVRTRDEARRELRKAETECSMLRVECGVIAAERDEARRDVCSMMHMTGFLGGDYAHSKGWDCFKDGHTGFSPEIQNFRDIFYGYKDELRAERDEARREVCELKSLNFEGKITPKGYAEMRKWDCFN